MICTTGHSLWFLYINKWPTRGFWNRISLLCAFPVFPPQLVLSDQDHPLSTGGGGLGQEIFFIEKHVDRHLYLLSDIAE